MNEARAARIPDPCSRLLKRFGRGFRDHAVLVRGRAGNAYGPDDLAVRVERHAAFHRARGLRAILEEVLLNTMYELPGRSDVGSVMIDADIVRTKVSPALVPKEPVVKRPRRQAS